MTTPREMLEAVALPELLELIAEWRTRGVKGGSSDLCADELEAALAHSRAQDSGGDAVTWEITWNDEMTAFSFDRCIDDDGSCRPLVYGDTAATPPPKVEAQQETANHEIR